MGEETANIVSTTGLMGAETGPDGKEKYKYAWPWEECSVDGKMRRWEYEHPRPWVERWEEPDEDMSDVELSVQTMWHAEQIKAVHPEWWEAVWDEKKYNALLEKEGLEVPEPDLTPRCTYTKSDGESCSAYAVRNTDLCYFHSQTSDGRRKKKKKVLNLPVLEDDRAIQMAVTNICRAVADDSLEPKRAATLLYGLQVATAALRRKRQQAEEESSGQERW